MYTELKFSTSAWALKDLAVVLAVLSPVTDVSTSFLCLALLETSAAPGVWVKPRVKP